MPLISKLGTNIWRLQSECPNIQNNRNDDAGYFILYIVTEMKLDLDIIWQ